jgi:hypothetical protein
MKKIISIALLLLGVSLASFAQDDSETHVGFGIKGGYNYSNLSISNSGEVEDKNALSSFNIGGYFDLPLAPVLSLQPGLMVSGKGAKFTYGDISGGNWYTLQTNPIYLELPVNLVGKIPFDDNSNLFFGAGVYGAMGVGGKYKVNGEVIGIGYSDEGTIEYSNDDPTNGNNGESGDIKRYDYGFNFLGGVELNHITLNVNYGLGLADIKPGEDNNDNDKFKNRVLSFSVGYLF